MKIGIEAQRLFREKKHGLEIVAMELIQNLQKIDKVNEYIIFVKEDKDKTCINETKNFKIQEIQAGSFPEWEQIRLPRAAKVAKVDLLHCTANTSPVFSSVPTILTLHDVIFMESKSIRGNYYQNLGNIYRSIILPLTLKKCRKIITVSESEKQQIQKILNLSPDRIEVIYNAVDSSFRKMELQELESIRQRYKLQEKFILFFGNPAQKKNTLETIKGYLIYLRNTNNPLPLVIAGAFEDYAREKLNNLNLPREILEKIKFIGYIPFWEQPAIYNLAELFLYTSKRESFGMPILESMACGTPVITSNTSSMPEIAGNAAILVNPFQAESIAQGIAKVLSNSTVYNALAELGYERAKQFSWEKSAKKTLDLYQTILK